MSTQPLANSKSHLKSSRSVSDVYPPVSLHHQYPQRSVSGWSYPKTEMSSYEHLPATFSNSQDDLTYAQSPPHSAAWSSVVPSEFEFYQTEGILNPPYYSDYEMDNQTSYDPYNVFDVDFSLEQSHLYQHNVNQHNKTGYMSPGYVHSNAPSTPSSGHSSPISPCFDYTEVSHTHPRVPSPASSSSSHSHPTQPPRTVSATDPKRRFPCLLPGCGRRFTSQYTLKVHTEAHRPKPRVTFPCTMGCSEKFSRQHDRLRHEVAKHNKICEHSCSDCGRFFSNAKTFGNHKCPVAKAGTRWITS